MYNFIKFDNVIDELAKVPMEERTYTKANEVVINMELVDAIPIPAGATNGDMIKAMFPNIKWWINTDRQIFAESGTLNLDWWNAPYKRGDKDNE